MKKMEKSVFRPMGQRNYEPPMTQVIVVEAQSVLCASVPDYGFVGSSLEQMDHGGFSMP